MSATTPTTTSPTTASAAPSTTTPAPTPGPVPRRAAPAARVRSLARAEVLLLLRNRTTLFNALAVAPATVAFLAWVAQDNGTGSDARGTGAFVLTSLAAVAIAFVVYYNLTTTLVARREELVLKRLLTGEVSRAEAVLACATPAVVVLLGQLVLGTVAVALWLDLPSVTHPLWIVVGLVGGTAAFVLLAVASSGLTRTVESAQLTTFPVVMVVMVLSGFTVPLDLLPDVVGTVASWTPMYPVVALLEAGLGSGDGSDLSLDGVGQPLLALILWIINGTWAARRWMRWEPRR